MPGGGRASTSGERLAGLSVTCFAAFLLVSSLKTARTIPGFNGRQIQTKLPRPIRTLSLKSSSFEDSHPINFSPSASLQLLNFTPPPRYPIFDLLDS
jgi:hypothetical protein